MKNRALIAFASSLFLLVAACGGDDDGGGDAGGPEMCVGSYASYNTETFADAAGTGACVNESDLLLTCVVDMSSLVGTQGFLCYQQNTSATPQELAACTRQRVLDASQTVTDPTDNCLNCYLASVGCTLTNCQTQCAQGASHPDCVSCRATNNCTSNFFTCSGLPTPPAP